MARDYVEILKRIEAHYPQALGSSQSQDPILKASITGFANDLINEIDREQRWSLAFNEPSFTTTAGTGEYALPFPSGGSTLLTQTFIDRVWWEDPTTGRITRMQRFNREELQRVFGDPVGTVNRGAPRYYTVQQAATYSGGSPTLVLMLYPTPDAAGPETGGNYLIRMSGYFNTPAILEVQGTTLAANATLTVASGTPTFLTSNGEPTASAGLGLNLSVRSAGNPGIGAVADTYVTGWTAFASATQITMSAVAPATATGVQCFFNSTNWMISQWPKLLIFGILREVASYYGSVEKYTVWEQRYQDQLKRLRDYEFDRARSMDSHVVAYAGGDNSALRIPDAGIGLDVRGGTIF